MNKPDLKRVLEINRIKEDAIAMLEVADKLAAELAAEHGFGRFDYALEEGYLKFELTDNVAALQNGEAVWKSVVFKPVSFVIQPLKNKPKSLK